MHQARLAAGLTLESGWVYPRAAVQKYEKGLVTPDSAKLLAIARACGVRTEYFFTRRRYA